MPDGEEMPIYDAAMKYADDGVPLVVLAGKEYGSGSSRDWAAKGTLLLGVRAVIAESFERIHRSNLIGMGVLPLQFPDGESAESLGLTGEEKISIAELDIEEATEIEVTATPRRRRPESVRRDGPPRHRQRAKVLSSRRNPPSGSARAALIAADFGSPALQTRL